MCGIVGYVGGRHALPILIDGLRRLEYRGYDSSGVVIARDGELNCVKAVGKIAALEARLSGATLEGRSGLGHTRWATHGGVVPENAHPHFSCDGRVAVVHNGIVENASELRREMGRHLFTSGTDTEVIPHLIEEALEEDPSNLLKAVHRSLRKLKGSFALGVLHAGHPERLVAVRVDCPLILGLGEGEHFLASDVSALLPYTRRVVPLDEGEIALVEAGSSAIHERNLRSRARPAVTIPWSGDPASKGSFTHYMEKEIHEQGRTLSAELAHGREALEGLVLPPRIDRVILAACGTAWHAALAGKSALEEFARLPAEAALASELRYADTPIDSSTLFVAVSQSGETADTLAAARKARHAGASVLALTNGAGSTLAREADQVLAMRTGPEIGVAATKTYTSQLLNLVLLAVHLGRVRRTLTEAAADALLAEARRLPGHAEEILSQAGRVREVAAERARGHQFMFMGRGYNLPTALEGALKMKEVTYLPVTGYGAGEMKHGPLALVDERMVCVAVAPRGRVFEKLVSNIQEVRARRGIVVAVATQGESELATLCDRVFPVPPVPEPLTPILCALPLQLLAYHTAVELGLDVDRPRNLAKSVTVE